MTKPDSKLDKALQAARDSDRAWRMNELPPNHADALGHILRGLGMKPLKPADLILVCGRCGDETVLARMKERIWICLACMESGPLDDLPALLKGTPPKPERRLVDSYAKTFDAGNARQFTRDKVGIGVFDQCHNGETPTN
jgi:hypothetical protein